MGKLKKSAKQNSKGEIRNPKEIKYMGKQTSIGKQKG